MSKIGKGKSDFEVFLPTGRKEGDSLKLHAFIRNVPNQFRRFGCRTFGVNPSSFYRFSKAQPLKDMELAKLIKLCHKETHQTYGYRRIKVWLYEKFGKVVNAKCLLRIMKKYHLFSKIRRKKRNYSYVKPYHIVENKLNRQFSAEKKNQKWVTDITYLHTQVGVFALSVIQDLYDRSVISFKVSTNATAELVAQTLHCALKKEKVADGLLLHSDQGTQYNSNAYQNLAQLSGVTLSMSRRGNCLDNSVIENFFSIIKSEWKDYSLARNLGELKRSITKFITFYNRKRISLKNKLTPHQMRSQSA